MASFEARHGGVLRWLVRAGSALTGPLEHGERTTEQSEGWPAGCRPVRRRPMDGPSANPGGRERTRSPWMDTGRVRGVAFSLVTFSWPRKRKSHALPGGGRKETWMSIVLSAAKSRRAKYGGTEIAWRTPRAVRML